MSTQLPVSSPEANNAQNAAHLRMMKTCPLCDTAYRDEDIVTLETQEHTQLVHMTCATCKHAMVAMMVHASIGLSSIGMVTDLNANDIRLLANRDHIGEEELFDFYTRLHKEPEHFIHSLMQKIV